MKNLVLDVFREIRVVCACVLFLFVLTMTGCSSVDTSSDLYQHIKSQTDQFANNTEQAKEDSIVYLTEKAYDFCNSLKRVAPFIIIGSFLFGILLLHIITEEQAIRQKAIFVFCVTIPAVTIILTYGLSWLVGTFL